MLLVVPNLVPKNEERPGSSILNMYRYPARVFPPERVFALGVLSRFSLQVVVTRNRAIFGADGVLVKDRFNVLL